LDSARKSYKIMQVLWKQPNRLSIDNAVDLYLESGWFESEPGHWLSWLRLFMIFLSHSKQISRCNFNYAATSFQIASCERFLSLLVIRRQLHASILKLREYLLNPLEKTCIIQKQLEPLGTCVVFCLPMELSFHAPWIVNAGRTTKCYLLQTLPRFIERDNMNTTSRSFVYSSNCYSFYLPRVSLKVFDMLH
jgi:hypothetical protein